MLDADIYGPSQPMMLGIAGRPESKDGKTLEPLEAYGLQAMSIGFLIDADTPMVWRGPMVTQALEQLLKDTNWRDLDYLIVDMPPGTGDIQLTLAQKVPVTGAVIVTTPQDIDCLSGTSRPSASAPDKDNGSHSARIARDVGSGTCPRRRGPRERCVFSLPGRPRRRRGSRASPWSSSPAARSATKR